MGLRGLSKQNVVVMIGCAASMVCMAGAIAVLVFGVMLVTKTAESMRTCTAEAEATLAAAQTETARPTMTPEPTGTPVPPTLTPVPADTATCPIAPPQVIEVVITQIVTITPGPGPAPTASPTVRPTPTPGELLGQVTTAGALIVSTDPNYAPQSFINDKGELAGFDIDVTREVAKRLGVEVEFVTPDWDMITSGNWGGRWDVSIGSMTITEDRSQVLWFADPYYYRPASFAVHKDNTTIKTPADLTGKAVGVGAATTYEAYLKGRLRLIDGQVMYDPPTGVHVKPYTTDAEAIQDLALGDGVRLDAVMSAQPTIQQAIASGVPLKYVGTPGFYESLAFALDKSRGPSDAMLAKLNEIIKAMHDDGTLTDLSLKWYGIDLTVIKPGE